MEIVSLVLALSAFVSAHAAELAAVCYALLNLANALAKGPEAKSKLAALANFLAVLTRKDAPGTLKAPLSSGEASPDLKALALFMAFTMGLSACACLRPSSDEYNSKKCVVARQALDCTKDSLVALLPLLPGIAVALLSGQAIDWAAIGNGAKDKGLANAACLLAVVQADFGSPAAARDSLADRLALDEAASLELSRRAGVELQSLVAAHYGGAVDVKLPGRKLLQVRAAR